VRLYWMRTVNVYCVVSAMSGNPELGPKLRTTSIAARRLNDAKVNRMRKAEKGEREKNSTSLFAERKTALCHGKKYIELEAGRASAIS
jgi:hypothetical protein